MRIVSRYHTRTPRDVRSPSPGKAFAGADSPKRSWQPQSPRAQRVTSPLIGGGVLRSSSVSTARSSCACCRAESAMPPPASAITRVSCARAANLSHPQHPCVRGQRTSHETNEPLRVQVRSRPTRDPPWLSSCVSRASQQPFDSAAGAPLQQRSGVPRLALGVVIRCVHVSQHARGAAAPRLHLA